MKKLYTQKGVIGLWISFLCLMIVPMVVSQSESTLPEQQAKLEEYQTKIDFFYYNEWDSVAYYAEQAQIIYQENQQWNKFVEKYNDVAVSAYYCNEMEVAKTYIEKATTAANEHQLEKNSPEFITILQTLAAYYYKKGNYTLAVGNMEEAISKLRQGEKTDSAGLQVAYISLSTFYKDKGDFDEGIEAAQRALQYTNEYKDLNVAALYNNLGLNYYNKFLFDEAYETYQKAAQLYQSFLEDAQYSNYANRNLVQVYNNIATNFSKHELYDSALVYLQKGLNATKSDKQRDQIFHNIGYAYYSKKQYTLAEKYVQQSVDFKKDRTKFPRIADNHNLLGRIEMAKGNHLKALQYLQKSLTAVIIPFNEQNDIFTHPELYDILSERKLLIALELRGDAFLKYYEQHQTPKYLEAALTSFKLATQLIEKSRRSYKAEGSKRFLSERAVPIFEKAINTAYVLYQKNKDEEFTQQAFEFAEKSKAVLLLAGLKEAEAKEFAGVNDSLIQQEQQLKAELAYNEREYQRAKRKKDTINVNKFQETLFEVGETYDYFIASLEEKYPDYYQLKYDDAVTSIDSIQAKLLDDSTAMMAFFVGEEMITLFSITTKETLIKQLKKPKNFNTTIFDFRRSLADLEFIQDSLQAALLQFGSTSHQLSNWLMDSTIIQNSKLQRLIIVPDGILGHLPFEVFLSQPMEDDDTFQSLSYLIHDYTIEYGYSATFLEQVKSLKKKTHRATYGGFAASYNLENTSKNSTREGLADLPNAIKEVEQIAKITNGDAWVGKKATEQRFKTIASDYQVLHLSMHGLLDDGNPLFSYLLFTEYADTIEDDQLTVLEIYNMKIQADLAVLSACNTGFGQIDKGEGVMSLSRAFAYAGCPSMVMSLWSVPDKSTSEIMVDFFESLKANSTTKSEALRQAKLAYLEDSDLLLSHPVFWAGFVAMGDNRPFEWTTATSFSYWWLLGVGVLLALVWIIIKRRNDNN